jgi:hypothetical protein
VSIVKEEGKFSIKEKAMPRRKTAHLVSNARGRTEYMQLSSQKGFYPTGSMIY